MKDLNRHLDRLENGYYERLLTARADLHRAGFSWTEVQNLPHDDVFELAEEIWKEAQREV